MTASRVFAALARTRTGTEAVQLAIAEVFPWVRHLSATERSSFTIELIAALSDAAELAIDGNAREVIAGWRATARVKADPAQHAHARTLALGDFGTVEVQA